MSQGMGEPNYVLKTGYVSLSILYSALIFHSACSTALVVIGQGGAPRGGEHGEVAVRPSALESATTKGGWPGNSERV